MTTTPHDDRPTTESLVHTIRAIRRSWAAALDANDVDLARRLKSQHDQFCNDLRNLITLEEEAMTHLQQRFETEV